MAKYLVELLDTPEDEDALTTDELERIIQDNLPDRLEDNTIVVVNKR